MDANEKAGRKLRRNVFRVAEEISRLFKADVSVQPPLDSSDDHHWILGVVGIGRVVFTPDAAVAAASVISSGEGKRTGKRRARRAAGKRKRSSGDSVEQSGQQTGSDGQS